MIWLIILVTKIVCLFIFAVLSLTISSRSNSMLWGMLIFSLFLNTATVLSSPAFRKLSWAWTKHCLFISVSF